ncbi:YkgJ family cysteine cluster protein [Sunxiuqinia sp. A32]
MGNAHFTEHDKAFYSDGYKLGNQQSQWKEDTLFSSIKTMYQAIDQLIDSLLAMAQREGISIDCKKGCSYCCQQAVFANSYEIHYLGNFIKTKFSRESQNDVFNKASLKNEKTKNLSENEILNFKSPCPLLSNGACAAYEARPMACRIYLSQKLSSCIEFYNNPENTENYPALLEFPLRAGRMMNEGYMAALKENGTMTAEFRLEEGLQTFLSPNDQ